MRPLLEVNSVIWSPHYKQDIDNRVQRRFTKRLPDYSNYTYNERLTLLNLPSLEVRRLRHLIDLIWCYKILFGLISIDSADLFEVRQATATRGHSEAV